MERPEDYTLMELLVCSPVVPLSAAVGLLEAMRDRCFVEGELATWLEGVPGVVLVKGMPREWLLELLREWV